MRLLRVAALAPFAAMLALFVHVFTGGDHEVAGGRAVPFGFAIALAAALWVAGIVLAAARLGSRSKRGGDARERFLPGGAGSRGLVALAATLAGEGIAAYFALEASEGRFTIALHGPLPVMLLALAAGAVGFATLVRTVAGRAAALGYALVERLIAMRDAPQLVGRRGQGPLVRSSHSPRAARGRAPPSFAQSRPQ